MKTNHLNFIPSATTFSTVLITVTLTLLLSACDNNKSKTPNSFTQVKVQKYSQSTTLKGKVSNKQGPIHSGSIKATDKKGKLITSTELQNSSNYSIKVPAGTELPLILTFYPDPNNKDQDKLVSVAISKVVKTYDINDLTTLIAKKAKALGGYTYANLVLAADSTVHAPDKNKTTAGFRGDPTKQYGGWH